MSDAAPDLTASASQTIGPFFHFGLATDATLGRLVRADTPGDRMRLRIVVLDGAEVPVHDALVEICQADAAGAYLRTTDPTDRSAFCGLGRLATGQDGSCTFETIRPGPVADSRGVRQAAHINVCLFARGLLRHLYTRIYFAGDPGLDADPILAAVPVDRRATLAARPEPDDAGTWSFVIRLQGDRETVFFDL